MKNFTYYNPNCIEFGKDKEYNIGQYLSDYGISDVLIVYGSERVTRKDPFDKIATSL